MKHTIERKKTKKKKTLKYTHKGRQTKVHMKGNRKDIDRMGLGWWDWKGVEYRFTKGGWWGWNLLLTDCCSDDWLSVKGNLGKDLTKQGGTGWLHLSKSFNCKRPTYSVPEFYSGQWCGSVGRAVSSDNRDLQIEYSHRQLYLLSTVWIKLSRKDKLKEKERPVKGPFKSTGFLQKSYNRVI